MHYQVVIAVELSSPLEQPSAPSRWWRRAPEAAVGFACTFGVRAPDIASAVRLACEAASRQCHGELDGEIINVEASRVEFEDWPEEVRGQCGDTSKDGAYYESGRAFYTDK